MSDGEKVRMAKSELRKKLYSIINALPRQEIIRQSNVVTEKILKTFKFQQAKVVSIYLSMDNEIQTENLLVEIFKRGKECFIPRFQAGCPVMEMIHLSSLEQYYALPKNKWNIKQPLDNEDLESVFQRGQLDLVLTPGLGFTKSGLRLGRGKGYYDNFFEKCKKELPRFPYTIGLAFKEQVLTAIPTETHDVTLDLIVTSE